MSKDSFEYVSGPIVIAFASPKGGVGKSTTCAALAGALLARGYGVHILDLDQTRTLGRLATRQVADDAKLNIEEVPEANFMERLRDVCNSKRGFILVDVAGAFGKTMMQAATVAHLTITPTKLSEPDIVQAVSLHREVANVGAMLGRTLLHRVVINEVSPLLPTYQRAALADIARASLPRFSTLLYERAPYAEIFLTGQTPHAADRSRPAVKKAVAEIDALADEILETLGVTKQEAA
jgi:chromosome partitioning protein